MKANQSTLGDITLETFLAEYWQKNPLLIRQGLPQFEDFLSPEELAGLSLEDHVESRLIAFNKNKKQWNLKQGPFTEQDYSNLPDNNWTLLIQSLDFWIPESRELIEQFNFIPGWRLDDLMVSYATDEGGVGPHLDQYDVFLVQGKGQRHWRVGVPGQSVSEVTPHPLLKQIDNFQPQIDEVLETGDVLYIPPNTPHWGKAISECITYSVGFRAPSSAMLMEQLLLDLLEKDEITSPRYQDNFGIDKLSQSLPGNVNQWLDNITETISAKDKLIAFGKLVTRLKNDIDEVEDSIDQIVSEISEMIADKQLQLQLPPESRVTFRLEINICHFWINGDYLSFPEKFAEWITCLCENRNTSGKNVNISLQDIEYINRIANLYKKGWLFFNHS
ncbi:MAG: cupin domain-containing protein [Gammaproteobacteria bacterium]|nr:cupin domain-containing protein [Gammaproteobacteria bacterium]